MVEINSLHEGWARGLPARRSVEDSQERAYYRVFAPVGTVLAEMVAVAGKRWAVEECFAAAKGEVGLDEYEVRSGTGWHRHITLALLALAYLAVVRAQAVGKTPKKRKTRPVVSTVLCKRISPEVIFWLKSFLWKASFPQKGKAVEGLLPVRQGGPISWTHYIERDTAISGRLLRSETNPAF